jgi:hypothetical protein
MVRYTQLGDQLTENRVGLVGRVGVKLGRPVGVSESQGIPKVAPFAATLLLTSSL